MASITSNLSLWTLFFLGFSALSLFFTLSGVMGQMPDFEQFASVSTGQLNTKHSNNLQIFIVTNW